MLTRQDPRILAGTVVTPEQPLSLDALYGPAAASPPSTRKKSSSTCCRGPPGSPACAARSCPAARLWLSTPNYGELWLPALEATVLELIARRDGFTRRDLHPSRLSARARARGLRAAGFESVQAKVTSTRLAITAWARVPR